VAKVDRESLLAGCPEDVKGIIAASGCPDRFYDQLQADADALDAATLAREKSADFSAAVRPDGLGRTSGAEAGRTAAQTYTPSPPTPLPPGARGAEGRGIEVVGSPEWQLARARWLAERDQRRIEEAERKRREQAERDAELRARRYAAAERRAWLDAGRVEW
jgi:hypothetical protein